MCSEPSPLDTGTCQLWQGQLLGHAKGNTQPCLACPQEEWASPDRRWHPRKAFKFRSAEGTGPGGYSIYMCGGPGECRGSSSSRRTCEVHLSHPSVRWAAVWLCWPDPFLALGVVPLCWSRAGFGVQLSTRGSKNE